MDNLPVQPNEKPCSLCGDVDQDDWNVNPITNPAELILQYDRDRAIFLIEESTEDRRYLVRNLRGYFNILIFKKTGVAGWAFAQGVSFRRLVRSKLNSW